VIVQYGRQHAMHFGLIHNEADIDNSQVVWARDLGVEKNDELVQYCRGRSVWTLDPDRLPLHLLPYRASALYHLP